MRLCWVGLASVFLCGVCLVACEGTYGELDAAKAGGGSGDAGPGSGGGSGDSSDSSDGGLVDADAGEPDAGTSDAGGLDAGESDAGTSDAGSSDAGGPDAGTQQPPDPNDPGNLDVTGQTIPTTNYPIPSGAVFMSLTGNDSAAGTLTAPVRTLNAAIGKAPAGGTVVVRGGTDAAPAIYRDWYKYHNTTLNIDTFGVITKQITIQAYPGEKAWFDGTDVIPTQNWAKQSGVNRWSMSWSTPSFCGTLPTATASNYYKVSLESQRVDKDGPCAWHDASLDPTNPMALDPQMVFIDGVYIKQVRTLAEVAADSFFYDWSNRLIVIGVDPTGKLVELASRPMAMQLNGQGSQVLGLGFKRYASHVYANNPGVIYGGRGQRFENVVFKQNAGLALMLDRPQQTVINRSIFVNNGGNGIGGNGSRGAGEVDNLTIENSLFSNNNTERFWTNCAFSCAAANIKVNSMIGFTIRNNIIEKGQGGALGAWCDVACGDGRYLNNVVRYNGGPGILDEISDKPLIVSNVVHDNGGAGIRVCSANARIYNNTVVNNSPDGPGVSYIQGNVWIYDDPRSKDNPDTANTGASAVGPDTANVSYVNNILVASVRMNNYQGARTDYTNTQPGQFFTALDFNAYWRTAGANQVLVRWSDASGNVDYRSVAAFNSAHPPVDLNSVDIAGGSDPFFVDAAAGDFRLRANHQAGPGTPLPADVAAVLGLSPGAALPKGAVSWPGKKTTP